EKLDRWLKDGITTPGGKLPSERELGELLGIKRMTLRQALLNLEAESKIFRKDRKGWFVTQPRFNYSPELSASFQRAAIEQGREPSWGFTEKNRTSDIPETLAPLIAVTPSTELYRITGWGALSGYSYEWSGGERMKQPSLYKLRGAVRITVTGGDIETLINTVAEQGLEVWDLRAHDGRVAEMNILLPHFFRLRPMLKRTGCRVKVTHRSGFPFFAARLLRRKFFLGGMLFFVAVLFALSSMVCYTKCFIFLVKFQRYSFNFIARASQFGLFYAFSLSTANL
ncbi:sporulation protein YqfD, partial [Acinetobacter sp. VT 511]